MVHNNRFRLLHISLLRLGSRTRTKRERETLARVRYEFNIWSRNGRRMQKPGTEVNNKERSSKSPKKQLQNQRRNEKNRTIRAKGNTPNENDMKPQEAGEDAALRKKNFLELTRQNLWKTHANGAHLPTARSNTVRTEGEKVNWNLDKSRQMNAETEAPNDL